MGFIYMITNKKSGEQYIGQTTRTIKERWAEHKEYATYKKEKAANKLHRDIYRLGKENFQVSQLEECGNDILDDRERYWIKYYHTFVGDECYSKGYNLTSGGNNGAVTQDPWNIKPVYQIDKDTRKILKIYSKIPEVIKTLNLPKNSEANISACCLGKQKSAYGFIWAYEDSLREKILVNLKNKKERPVYQIDIHTQKIIQEFPSVAEASFSIDGTRESSTSTTIATCARGGCFFAYGFQWSYTDIYNGFRSPKHPQREVFQIDPKTNEIIKVYNSMCEAGRAIGHVNGSAIKDAIKRDGFCCGYRWKVGKITFRPQKGKKK